MNTSELLPGPPSSENWDDVRAWRKATRTALIDQRVNLASHFRRAQGEQVKGRLTENNDLRRFETLGIYWPIRGEIDVRDLARKHIESGGRVALPVVVARASPVEFWEWKPGTRMSRGLWDIPIPAERELLHPDALIVPLVGFDTAGYRLGYGGGYYDRTLEAASPRPFCIGVGYGASNLRSIYPQAHDIPMDVIATERLFVRTREAPRPALQAEVMRSV